MKLLEYKGFKGSSEFSSEDDCYFGKLLDVGQDLIMYEGKTLEGLEKDFRETVDEYIDLCERVEKRKKKTSLYIAKRSNSMNYIKETIDEFLNDDEMFVLLLKGKWGIGKTYFWEEIYIKEKIEEKKLKQNGYSYVSLFGKSNLSDLKHDISSNQQLSNSEILKTKKYLNNFISRVKNFKVIGSLKNLLTYKKIDSIISAFQYSSIEEYLICFDDLERKSKKPTMLELMGLIDDLKKKKCKIVIIFNENTLEEPDSQEFKKYREKVVDLEVEYNPSIEENLEIVFDEKDFYFQELKKVYKELDSNNIRIFLKTKWAISKIPLKDLSDIMDESLQIDLISHLAFIVWGHYNSENRIEDFNERLLKSDGIFSGLWESENKKLSEEDKKLKDMVLSLEFETAEYDTHLIHLLKKGYLDDEQFIEDLKNPILNSTKLNIYNEMQGIWDLYHDSFADNQDEIVSKFKTFVDSDDKIKHVSINDFDNILLFIESFNEDVSGYIGKYINNHKDSLKRLKMQDKQFYFRENRNQKLKVAVDNLQVDHGFTIDSVAKNLAEKEEWNNEMVDFLAKQTVDDLYNWMKSNPEDIYLKIKKGLLMFEGLTFTNTNEKENYTAIINNTKEALKKIGKENELNKRRVKNLYDIDL